MNSKEMSAFVRPNLDLTLCIAHGYGLCMGVSWPWVAKDSNATADMVLHTVHTVAEAEARKRTQFELRSTDLYLQCDNTPRETKNMTLLRLLSSMVSAHLIHRAQLQCLQSGHSHEDVDQAFSLVSAAIQDETELEDPAAFCACLERLLSRNNFRPLECERWVKLVTCSREWNLGLQV